MYDGMIENGKPHIYKTGYLLDVEDSFKQKQIYPLFSWGNTKGSGQLAFAILFEEYGYDFAESNYKDFQARVISKLDAGKDFKLTKKEIEYWRKNPK